MRELINFSNLNLIEILGCSNSCISYLSILNGKAKGKEWVDSLNRPSFAIVWSGYLDGFHEHNDASKKTATKQGLEFHYQYKVYWFGV